jgi:pimeloyl-ACP methyl ester carboxylesterase
MRLIEALTDEPANVFGTSGGALIGLNLAARHPERVRTLVAHEPPCVDLLVDPSAAWAIVHQIFASYSREGVESGMQTFMQLTGMAGEPPQSKPTAEGLETFARIEGNMNYFFAHGLKPLSRYVPDVNALRAGPVQVVVGAGQSSEGHFAHRTAVALAAKLGTQPLIFPGGHGGYGSHADIFAETLNCALQ